MQCYVKLSENLFQEFSSPYAGAFRSLQNLTGTKSYHGPFRVKTFSFFKIRRQRVSHKRNKWKTRCSSETQFTGHDSFFKKKHEVYKPEQFHNWIPITFEVLPKTTKLPAEKCFPIRSINLDFDHFDSNFNISWSSTGGNFLNHKDLIEIHVLYDTYSKGFHIIRLR